MPALSVLAIKIADEVFGYLFSVAIEESSGDAALRQRLRELLGKKSPEQLAFQMAVERALKRLEKEHPGWRQSLFDEPLLTGETAAGELSKCLRQKGEPDARALALAWAQNAGTDRPDLQREAQEVAATFIALLEEELDAADVRPALAPLRTSRDLKTLIDGVTILADQSEVLQGLVEQVLQQLQQQDGRLMLLTTQMEILTAAARQGLVQIQRRDVTIYGDAKMAIIVTGDGNVVNVQLPTEAARELARNAPHQLSALHLDYLRHWFGKTWAVVKLADMLRDQEGEVDLLDVYVPLRLDFNVIIEVKDHRIVDWWADLGKEHPAEEAMLREMGKMDEEGIERALREKPKIKRWDALGVDEAGMQAIIDGIQRKIERRREQGEETKDGEHSWFMEAQDAASVSPRFVLLGAPGAGKSSFLRHLTLCLAGELRRRAGETDVPAKANLDEALNHDWLLDAYTPLYVEIRELVREAFPALPEREEEDPDMPDVDAFWRYVKTHVLGESMAGFLPELQRLFAHGQAMLMLDGLDEAPQAADPLRRQQIKSLIASLVRTYPRLRIIITSRPHAYRNHEWSLKGFGRTELRPLDLGRLHQLARALFAAAGEPDPNQEADAFIKAIQQAKIEESLRGTPLFFTMLAALWLDADQGERTLPTTRAALYRESVDLLLDRWTRRRLPDPSVAEQLGVPEPAQLRVVLETLALEVQDQSEPGEDTTIFKGELLAVLLYRAGIRVIPQDLTDYLSQHAGILVSPSPGEFHFVHRSFQEHLAACKLASAQPSFPQEIIRRVLEQPDLWNNVLRLAVDELFHQDRPDDAWELLSGIVLPYLEEAREHPHAHQAALLALDIAQRERFFASYDRTRDRKLRSFYEDLQQAAAKALTDTERFRDPEQRDIAGRLLGWGDFPGHDSRPGVGVKEGLPDFDWVCIPAGEFPYQNGTWKLKQPFWITRFPVTRAQFETFLQAEDGFYNPEWWKGLAASESHRRSPGQQRFEYWNHPRENVSWYDAIAFSRWLTAKARERPDLLPPELRDKRSGWRITLPTEWQWERAARWTDGRQYPWGLEYEIGYANVDETWNNSGPHYLQKTSAVGMYPQGKSPDGVLDISGNVWEWCLNEYDHPERVQEAGDAARVLRGGSWLDFILGASAVVRGWVISDPGDRVGLIGFRLVVSVPH